MDTRRKIVSAAEAVEAARRRRREGGKVAVETGSFDVLQAAHARELAEACGGGDPLLVAVIIQPAEPVLSARARAEMVAGLAVVDYVVIAEDRAGLERFLAEIAVDRAVRNETVHSRRIRQLIQHVQGRQTGG